MTRGEAGVGEIVHLYVDARVQGRNVGTQLFDAMAAHLLATGHNTVRLSVVEGNRAAIRYYERRGGRFVGTFADGNLWVATNRVYEWLSDPLSPGVRGGGPQRL